MHLKTYFFRTNTFQLLFAGAGPEPAKGGKGGKKGGKGKDRGELVDGTMIGDYRTEYAKSGASTCKSCEEKIKKVGSIRKKLLFTCFYQFVNLIVYIFD